MDVEPADERRRTTLTLRAVTESGAEIDRVVIERTAGAGGAHRQKLNDTVA